MTQPDMKYSSHEGLKIGMLETAPNKLRTKYDALQSACLRASANLPQTHTQESVILSAKHP